MARTFGGATSDRGVVTAAANHNTLTEFTFIVRAKPTTLTDNRRLCCKCSNADGSARQQIRISGTSGDLLALVTGNAANGQSVTTGTPFTTGKWYTVAMTSSNTGDKTPHIYIGAEDGELAEASYASQTAYDSLRGDETGSFVWGNGRPVTDSLAFQGDLADGIVCNVVLGLDELIAIHNGARFARGQVINNRLWGNVSPEPDLTPNGNAATITGATRADHPPMSKWTPRPKYRMPTAAVAAAFTPRLALLGVG